MPPEIERDDADATAVHALSRDAAGRVVATGRLLERGRPGGDRPDGGRRRPSAAAGTVPRCSPSCTARRPCAGCGEVELHAQVSARGFYERAGYTAVGEEYLEAGIRHVTMRRHAPCGGESGGRVRAGRGAARACRPPQPRRRPGEVQRDGRVARSGRETHSVRPSE